MSAEDNLTPEQREARRDMLEILAAYDAAPAETQREMREAVRSGGDYKVPKDLMETGRIAGGILEVQPGKTTAEAARDAKTLQQASREIPGIGGLIRSLKSRRSRKV